MSVSAETPQPQRGDVVQVTYKAVWDQDRGTHYWLRDLTDGTTASVPNTASVEVLERADDPKVGEIRREDHSGGYSLWQVEETHEGERYWRCTHSTAKGNLGTTFRLNELDGVPVIGAVPGTPAAVAQAYEGLPPSLRRDAEALAARGDKVGAAHLLTFHGGLSEDAADACVEGMSEYQAYLAAHGEPVGEARKLLVHPHVWKPLTAWLNDTRVRLVPRPAEGDQTPLFGMEPMDGEWP